MKKLVKKIEKTNVAKKEINVKDLKTVSGGGGKPVKDFVYEGPRGYIFPGIG